MYQEQRGENQHWPGQRWGGKQSWAWGWKYQNLPTAHAEDAGKGKT